MTDTIEERAEAATGHYNYHKIPKWAWEDGYKIGYREGYDAGRESMRSDDRLATVERNTHSRNGVVAIAIAVIGVNVIGVIILEIVKCLNN